MTVHTCGRQVTPPCTQPVTWVAEKGACDQYGRSCDRGRGQVWYCEEHAARAQGIEREYRVKELKRGEGGLTCLNEWCHGHHRFITFTRIAELPVSVLPALTWEQAREKWVQTQDDADWRVMMDLVVPEPQVITKVEYLPAPLPRAYTSPGVVLTMLVIIVVLTILAIWV